MSGDVVIFGGECRPLGVTKPNLCEEDGFENELVLPAANEGLPIPKPIVLFTLSVEGANLFFKEVSLGELVLLYLRFLLLAELLSGMFL